MNSGASNGDASISVGKRDAFDVCVICAKPDEARHVVDIFKALKGFRRIPGTVRSEILYLVNDRLTVKVTSCADMGHMSAAVRVAQILATSTPSFIVFVGTAASLKPHEIQLGDVVIPKRAVVRSYDKISEAGQRDYDDRKADGSFREFFFDDTALISELSTMYPSDEMRDLLIQFDYKSILLEDEVGQNIAIAGEVHMSRTCRIHDDVDIFSCGMVVDSISYRNFIVTNAHTNLRKVAVIDMESHGFFTAIASIPLSKNGASPAHANGIMIRGISDYAGRKSQIEALPDGWRSRAIRNAATVTSSLVRLIADMSDVVD